MAEEPQCCKNPPTLSSSCGSGRVEEFGGINSYICGPSDSKSAVLLVSDVFGYEAPKLRKIADKLAADGFFVVVPDFLHGEPFSLDNPNRPFQAWIADHSTDKVAGEAIHVIEALKSKGVSKIGAAGFCWGAKVIVELAKHPYIHAAVLLHPSFVTVDEIKGVKVPISILGAQVDHITPPELLKQFGEALEAKPEVDSFVKMFPGVQHGFSVRWEDGDEVATKSAEEAHKDMLDWFGKYIK